MVFRCSVWGVLGVLLMGQARTAPADETTSPFHRDFSSDEREYWAFQPVVRPEVPDVHGADWVRTPIDAFLLAKMEATGIEPSPPATRLVLLRRIYLDLIGLPPSPEAQRAFLEDDLPGAYERVVDHLLARPEYGERWARHWLDVVRYAESNGYERDGAKPHAWRYRDYVIRSLNGDKPYDQFLIEQLAGDEIDATNAETQIATTFLRLGTWDDEPAEPKVDRYDQLDDILSTTSATFLGLTIACARCHNHKFEPLTQLDYARLLAVFEPLKRPQNGRTDLDRFVGTPEELSVYRDAMAKADARVAGLRGQLDELARTIRSRLFDRGRTSLTIEAIAAFQSEDDKRTDAQKKLVEAFKNELAEEVRVAATSGQSQHRLAWEQEIEAVDVARPKEPPRAYVLYEDGEHLETHVFVRGDPTRPSDRVLPGVPAIFRNIPDTKPAATPTSTGRRLWLARWLTRSDHPLTARVIVNRVWQRHFGDGIVATENDFGTMGDLPTHPKLLDWLADEFVRGEWRLKRLHRRIVLSSAYRMSSQWNEPNAAKDPDEKLIWRWKPRRLEAEPVRDSILAASGRLNRQMGGPSIYPKIARAVLEGQSRPGDGWGKSDPMSASRRSVYVFVKRSLLVPELELLDFPDGTSSCAQRAVSTTAPQALTLFNGAFVNEQAQAFASRLKQETGEDRASQVSRAFELALCRKPSREEMAAVLEFLLAQTEQIRSDRGDNIGLDEAAHQALKAFCLVLLNSNEFVYLD